MLRFIITLLLSLGIMRAAVAIDTSVRFQTMGGFGTTVRLFDDPHLFDNFDQSTKRAATVVSATEQDQIMERLYGDLRLTWVRPATDPGMEPQNDNDDPEVTDLSAFDFSWKRNDGHVSYVQRAMERGVKWFFPSPILRESWMGNTSENDVAEYAEWCLTMIRRWRQLGLDLPYFSPANEPGHKNDFSGEFLRDLIRKMGPVLRAENFPTMFVITDDLNPPAAYDRCKTILADDEARQYVGAIATHLYGTPLETMGPLRELADRYGLPLWMTEYSRGEMRASAIDYADRIMHPLIADYNVSVQLYMWGFFGQWEPPSFQLITLKNEGSAYRGFEADKMYYVLRQFSRYIDPGSVRVQAQTSGTGTKVTAYVADRKLTVVAINNSTETVTEQFAVTGFADFGDLQAVRTSDTEDAAVLSPVPVDGSQFSAVLPPRSITTFTTLSRLDGNEPPAHGSHALSRGAVRR